MKGFGALLKELREKNGISTQEVSEKTKINLSVILKLENEEFDNLPGPAFVKGFIKSYCKVLKEKPDEIIKRYEESYYVLKSVLEKKVKNKLIEEKEIKINYKNFFAITTFIISIIILIYYMNQKNIVKAVEEIKKEETVIVPMIETEAEKNVVEETEAKVKDSTALKIEENKNIESKETVVEEIKKEEQKELVNNNLKTEILPASENILETVNKIYEDKIATEEVISVKQKVLIIANKRVWVKIKEDEKEPYDFIMQEGTERLIEADNELKLVVGDGSAVTLVYNENKTIKNFGLPEKPRSIVFPSMTRWQGALQ